MDRFYANLLRDRVGVADSMTTREALEEAQDWLRALTLAESTEKLGRVSDTIARGVNQEQSKAANNSVRSSASNPYDHPYYWGAFVLIGHAR